MRHLLGIVTSCFAAVGCGSAAEEVSDEATLAQIEERFENRQLSLEEKIGRQRRIREGRIAQIRNPALKAELERQFEVEMQHINWQAEARRHLLRREQESALKKPGGPPKKQGG